MDLSVSVIIPCYNVENYIRDAVNSIFQQKGIEIELICVDDCSDDKTFEVLQEMKTVHPEHFFIYRNDTNKGAAFSRNRGLESAKGIYIQFLDADDFLLPGKISHQLDLCKSQEQLPGFIAGDYVKRNASGEEKIITADSDNPWYGLMKTRLGCTCSNLWKRTALQAVNGFDMNLKSSQEYDLMFRLLKNGATVIHDDRPLTLVRERKEGSISSLDRGANWKRYVQLRCNILAYMKAAGKLDANNQQDFNQVLFDAIRCWYPYAHDEALEVYGEFIPSDFVPSPSAVTSGNYIRLFRLLGFKLTEKIKMMGKSK